MSFLEEIKNKKQSLTHAKTIVRDIDGNTYIEDVGKGHRKFLFSGTGYVIDTKPDLSVAEVLPGLLMGSQDVAQSQTVLEQHNVNHVLSLGVPVVKLEGYHYTFFETLDLPEFSISNIFPNCFDVINSARKEGKTIYVHCNAGISRSATVVIAYLMKECSLTFNDAYNYLKKIRPFIKPNEGFISQLLLYEENLRK